MYSSLHNAISDNANRLIKFPASAKLFLQPGTQTPVVPVGQIFRNEDMAQTLELMALQGTSAFYFGEIAHDIVSTAREAVNPDTGKYGLLTIEDIAGYRSVYREPVHAKYRGHEVYGFPPPASGGIALLQTLNYLEAFDLPEFGPLSLDSIHPIVDAQNIAFADRNKFIGDADFVDVPIEGLLDKNYMRRRRTSLASPYAAITTPISPGHPAGAPEEGFAVTYEDNERGTTHWSIVDSHGNCASFTSTIEMIMGSAVVVSGRGFLLNNELTDFEAYESDQNGVPYANAPAGGKKLRRTALGADALTYGGKRPRSSMTPTMAFNSTNGALYMATGSPGGSSIIGATINVFLNVADFGLDLQEATDLARVLGKNGETSAEAAIYETEEGAVFSALKSRGFNFTSPVPTTATYGQVQTIVVGRDGNLYGAADKLRASQALAAGF